MQKTYPKHTHGYKITVDGHLGDHLTNAFRGLEVNATPGGRTIISGQELDQSALFGLLLRIRDLGLPLLSVIRTDLKINEPRLSPTKEVNNDRL
jgi:hypothetical protein